MWHRIIVWLSVTILLSGLTTAIAGVQDDAPRYRVLAMELDAAISPAEADLVSQATAAAASGGYDLLLVRLDTPGGTLEATRGIIKSILNSAVPVAVWVGPSGARAASAGVFIVASAHVAAMAPQTTIGAAMPVDLGGDDVPKTMARKVMNDIKSMVRAMAESRGRNVDWYMKAVDESDSITATEALKLNVVDILVGSPQELVAALGEGRVTVPGKEIAFGPEGYEIEDFDPGWRYRLLSWLLNPQVAYLLLLAGMAGVFFELIAPGTLFPGIVGSICLLLALYALSILTTNVTGILFLLLGLLLFFLEINFISYGLLSIAGIASLLLGSLILFPAAPGSAGLPLSTIIVTVGCVAIVLGVGVYLAAKAQMAKPASGREGLVGSSAAVRRWQDGKGLVFVHGEMWSARTADGSSLKKDEEVRITRVDGLTLIVERTAAPSRTTS